MVANTMSQACAFLKRLIKKKTKERKKETNKEECILKTNRVKTTINPGLLYLMVNLVK